MKTDAFWSQHARKFVFCTFAICVSLVFSFTGCAGGKSAIKSKNDPSGPQSDDIPSSEDFKKLAAKTGKAYAYLISEPIDDPAYNFVTLQPFERTRHGYKAHYVLLWSGHYGAHGCPKRESKADCRKFGSPPRIFIASIVSASRSPEPYVEPRWSSPNVDFPRLTPAASVQNAGAYGDLLDAEYHNETLRVRVKHEIFEDADTTTTKVFRYHFKFDETNRNWRLSRKEKLEQKTDIIGRHYHYSD